MRRIILSFVLLCAISGGFLASPPGRRLLQQVGDKLDPRPVETILLIGNSRTYYHDMPDMIRKMADSAHAKVRFAVTTRAWGGASFEENWNDEGVQGLLKQRWDGVILQAESRAAVSDDQLKSFQIYGDKLIVASRMAGSPTALIINWGYGSSLFTDSAPGAREGFIQATDEATKALAAQTGAGLIDTSAAWEKVLDQRPKFELYEDGNHPTIYGSFLSAMMIYAYLGGDVNAIRYRPASITVNAADQIKAVVASYYHLA